MSADSRAPQRIVVRMPNWLGDTVMALPAVVAVREAHPQASLAIAAPPSIAPMFEEDAGVHQQALIAVDKSSEAATLREGKFDTLILLPNSFHSAWVGRRAGIPHRWGYRSSVRGTLLTRAVPRPRRVHQSTYYSELMRGLGVPVNITAPRVRPLRKTQERATLLLETGRPGSEPIVGFAPGAAYGHAKRWPPERVAHVITRLVRERQAQCVLVGAESDRESGRAIESALPPDVPVTNLIGRTDLRLLIGVLARCNAFVSNDSGAMHLAAATGVHVTAIFGPTNEKETAPLGDHDVLLNQVFCRPCMLRECPIDHRCMKRITTDEVFASVAGRL